jgi:hypothetical protein
MSFSEESGTNDIILAKSCERELHANSANPEPGASLITNDS